jgi:uncharacterized protein (TIGR01777 family)
VQKRRVIAGGSGLIGQAVARDWLARGYDVVILTRSHKEARGQCGRSVYWDGVTQGDWIEEVDGSEVVLNLCGASIGEGRWTDKRKAIHLSSRVLPTRLLVAAINESSSKPDHYLQASAVGFYGSGSTPVDERCPAGGDYLADLGYAWEAAAAQISVPCSTLRFGVVLDPKQGALTRLLLPFKLGVGGPLGSGRQWLSWIHIGDLVAAVDFVIDRSLSAPINVTAPEPLTNTEFAATAARILKRPDWLRTPAFALQLLLGEQAGVVLEGQRVVPRVLLDQGFAFSYPTMMDALTDLTAQ